MAAAPGSRIVTFRTREADAHCAAYEYAEFQGFRGLSPEPGQVTGVQIWPTADGAARLTFYFRSAHSAGSAPPPTLGLLRDVGRRLLEEGFALWTHDPQVLAWLPDWPAGDPRDRDQLSDPDHLPFCERQFPSADAARQWVRENADCLAEIAEIV